MKNQNLNSLSAWFEDLLFGGEKNNKNGIEKNVVTVIGSGGKTSLIWHLAASLVRPPGIAKAARRRVLVTPTTKMFVPLPETDLYDFYYGGQDDDEICRSFLHPDPGITLAGIFNNKTGKLESLLPDHLEKIIHSYDLVLIEGDGSRGLPLKAWKDDEPVVPPFTDFTIGILPLGNLGEPVSDSFVHGLPIFFALSGAAPKESLKIEHIKKLITGRMVSFPMTDEPDKSFMSGLFVKARGRKILFFNQVEDEVSLTYARELADTLQTDYKDDFFRIIAGSVKEDKLMEL